MVRVVLQPNTPDAGGRRVFHTLGVDYARAESRLVLRLRDGQMCLQLFGDWQVELREALGVAHSISEAERIHDGSALVVMA